MEESTSDGSRREFWAKHLSDSHASGLSYAGYCRRHDLKESTFSYWRRRLSAAQPGRSGFVELKVTAGDRSGIEIILRNQIKLGIEVDFDEVVLKRVIGVLESI
jgi:transposase-like protein